MTKKRKRDLLWGALITAGFVGYAYHRAKVAQVRADDSRRAADDARKSCEQINETVNMMHGMSAWDAQQRAREQCSA